MRTLLLLLALLPTVALAQRQSIDLNREWTFAPGWETRPGVGDVVNLPHTWNTDALNGNASYYRGLGNYIKVIEVPRTWSGKRVFIRFGGANTVCDFYINSKHVGQHRGGYTAFGWEITPWLNYGERNTLWVRASNTIDLDVPPLVGDFNVYGGLYRSMELVVTPDVAISDDDFGSRGLYITTTSVTDEQADINTQAHLSGPKNGLVNVGFTLRDATGATLDTLTRRIQLDSAGRSLLTASFTIPSPRRWNGTADPYLYSMEARISGGKGYDQVQQNFGIRTVSVDADNHFLLNGKPLRIQGVVRIEDWDGLGGALHRENHRRDIAWMQEMGVNAVRMAYFPGDPYFLDLCDRAGILVWAELPLVGAGPHRDKGFNDSQDYKKNARTQLLEMIRQHYNHPSVAWWGLFDQLTQKGDDPLALIQELNRLAKAEDSRRLTVAASNQDGELNFVTDLIGFNQFMGWTNGQPEEVEGWTRDLRREFPRLLSGLSGYGAGASIYQHTDSLSKPALEGNWHPEQWQSRLHEHYWNVIAAKPNFWGTFAWSMFDYGAAHRTDGARPGLNDCGLVTFDRATAKDAFYFYKANWNPNDAFVYLAERRWDVRQQPRQILRVYSNRKEVELFVNGLSQGVRKNDGLGRFVWQSITLKAGENSVTAIDPDSGERDQIEITIVPEATTLPASPVRTTPVTRNR